ncbi:MAG: hypothetical protein EOO87_16045 [Pedobacter sp.]|nr:MAG: hypothetical protein EOO87_16045 [Pedobacter sp.]
MEHPALNIPFFGKTFWMINYAFVVAMVAIHNIWLLKENNSYQEAGMSMLIGRTSVHFAEAPLLFLLGLVDMIEPVKAFPGIPPDEVLKTST